MSEYLEAVRQAVESGDLAVLKLTGPVGGGDSDLKRVSVRPVKVRSRLMFQVARRIGRKEVHENLGSPETIRLLDSLFPASFRECTLERSDSTGHFQCRLDGRVTCRWRQTAARTIETDHDRRKEYLIPERKPCAFLHAIGVMRADGSVRSARYGKFRQVNRFLELVNDVQKELPATGTLRIVDFGCGKSYLTFALHHLFRNILHRDVELIGLDRDPAVIETCRSVADQLQLTGMEFQQGDIAGCQEPRRVDMVVSLHACDTATDAALARAMAWRPAVILAVPCCQHELAPQLEQPQLAGLLRHGILRERFAAMVTDALRADVLEQSGYETQILEFIDLEHTAKNLMLRAVRRNLPRKKNRAIGQIHALRELLNIHQFSLHSLMESDGGTVEA